MTRPQKTAVAVLALLVIFATSSTPAEASLFAPALAAIPVPSVKFRLAPEVEALTAPPDDVTIRDRKASEKQEIVCVSRSLS